MTEFAAMEDWGLQAVVTGCTNDFTTPVIENPVSCFGSLDIKQDQELLFAFPDLFDTTTVLGNELEELYKPFYPMFHPLSTQTIITSSNSVPKQVKEPEKVQEKQSLPGTATTVHAAKYKRRKNQNKRVVLNVKAEGLSSDMWAWRKYGQKPIKGSPYPRSYYRCSSSKGCLARKQVEQSCSDPGMFIISYTAEHSHTQPTRRNSLAGTTRHKFSTPKSHTTGDPDMPKAKDSTTCSPISTEVLSPTTPLMASIEPEFLQQPVKQERRDEGEEQMGEESNDNKFAIPDLMLSDDFFAGLEDLDGLTSDFSHQGLFYKTNSDDFL